MEKVTKTANGFITHVGNWPREGQNGTPYASVTHGRMVMFQPDNYPLGTNSVILAVDSETAKKAFRKAYRAARQQIAARAPLYTVLHLDDIEVEGGKLYARVHNLSHLFFQDPETRSQFTLRRHPHVDEETGETWETWVAGRIARPRYKLP